MAEKEIYRMTSIARRRRTAVPLAVRTFGWLGVLPFWGCAAAAVAMPGEIGEEAGRLLLAYGAVILSFLGGIRWGGTLAGAAPETGELCRGIFPALVGWAAFFVPVEVGYCILALAFAVVLFDDCRASEQRLLPDWYPAIRIPLTLAVVAALVLPAVMVLRASA